MPTLGPPYTTANRDLLIGLLLICKNMCPTRTLAPASLEVEGAPTLQLHTLKTASLGHAATGGLTLEKVLDQIV